jgi:hypothetical protein
MGPLRCELFAFAVNAIEISFQAKKKVSNLVQVHRFKVVIVKAKLPQKKRRLA